MLMGAKDGPTPVELLGTWEILPCHTNSGPIGKRSFDISQLQEGTGAYFETVQLYSDKNEKKLSDNFETTLFVKIDGEHILAAKHPGTSNAVYSVLKKVSDDSLPMDDSTKAPNKKVEQSESEMGSEKNDPKTKDVEKQKMDDKKPESKKPESKKSDVMKSDSKKTESKKPAAKKKASPKKSDLKPEKKRNSIIKPSRRNSQTRTGLFPWDREDSLRTAKPVQSVEQFRYKRVSAGYIAKK